MLQAHDLWIAEDRRLLLSWFHAAVKQPTPASNGGMQERAVTRNNQEALRCLSRMTEITNLRCEKSKRWIREQEYKMTTPRAVKESTKAPC